MSDRPGKSATATALDAAVLTRLRARHLRHRAPLRVRGAQSALARRESRGAHQRLDFPERDDRNFLRHSMASFAGQEPARISYRDVVITKSQPGVRDYSGHHE